MAGDISNILVHSIHDRQLRIFAKAYLKGRLIDIGCGEKPYETLLAPHIDSHVGIDQRATLHDKSNIDAFGTAYHLPCASGSFDAAICTAVLEHLEEPEAALVECFRVLKSGGSAIYSAPFIWHLHEEPRDFYRYSKYGLQYLFQKAGFQVVEVTALSGFWVTFGQLFVYNLFRLNRGPIRWLHLLDPLGLLIQGVALALEKIDRTEKWTWMYMVVARRP